MNHAKSQKVQLVKPVSQLKSSILSTRLQSLQPSRSCPFLSAEKEELEVQQCYIKVSLLYLRVSILTNCGAPCWTGRSKLQSC